MRARNGAETPGRAFAPLAAAVLLGTLGMPCAAQFELEGAAARGGASSTSGPDAPGSCPSGSSGSTGGGGAFGREAGFGLRPAGKVASP